MLTVQLSNLRFYAFHGVYEEESAIGSNYEVNVAVSYHEMEGHFESLRDVLNYEELYKIVQKRMNIPTLLLEEVAEGIITTIRQQYSYVTEVSVSIYKLQAPIEHFQ